MQTCGNAGRGSHRLAMNAAEEVWACRKGAAELFGASPERVIFTLNTTLALNVAIKTALRDHGGAILMSDLEHNSVYRPSITECSDVRIFDSALEITGRERTEAILESIRAHCERGTNRFDQVRVLVCTAASNIIGAAMPIREIGEFCRERGIFFIVDGAQAGGILPLDVKRDHIDVLCLPSHKGLLGPMGAGLMILGEEVSLQSYIEGGSGVNSREARMPELPPERYEAGTLPLPAIAGLRRGIEFVRMRTPEVIRAHEAKLAAHFKHALGTKLGDRVMVYAPQFDGGIVLFNYNGIDSEDLARRLDAHGIAVRAGLHCSPLAHDRLGSHGAVRVSFGVFNALREVNELVGVLAAMK